MGHGDYQASLVAARQGLELWKRSGKIRGWEVDVLEQFACWCLQLLGEIPELQRRVQNKIQEALDTGNRYAEVVFRVCFPYTHFADDDPDSAYRETVEAMRTWVPASHLFGPPNYWAAKTKALYVAYTGQEGALTDELAEEWRRLDQALLGRVGIIRMEALEMRGLVAASRARLASQRGDGPAFARFVLELKGHSRKIRKTSFVTSEAIARLLDASVLTLERDREGLIAALEFLKSYSEEIGMKLGAVSVVRRLGQVLGKDRGRALIEESDARFREARVVNPEKFTRLSLPVGWADVDGFSC